MDKTALILGSAFGLFTVVIGAFGAHALRDLLEVNERVDVFETAVRYQGMHAIVLLFVGLLSEKIKNKWLTRAVFFFSIGIFIFSGSLYALSVTEIGFFGAIAPIGGLSLVSGWISLMMTVRSIR